MIRKLFIVLVVSFVVFGFLVPLGQAKDAKIGYVDLRRAFYEYEKTKTFEQDLTEITDTRQEGRVKKVSEISKLRAEKLIASLQPNLLPVSLSKSAREIG